MSRLSDQIDDLINQLNCITKEYERNERKIMQITLPYQTTTNDKDTKQPYESKRMSKNKIRESFVCDKLIAKKQYLLICGYIRQLIAIQIPSVIVDMIRTVHDEWVNEFKISENGMLIQGRGYSGIYAFKTQSLFLDRYSKSSKHLWSINTLNTPYESFGYIGIQRQEPDRPGSLKNFNPNKHCYRYKPKRGEWFKNQILTVELDYGTEFVRFYSGTKRCADLERKNIINGSKEYYFIVHVDGSDQSCVQIVSNDPCIYN
eukprot:548696_1